MYSPRSDANLNLKYNVYIYICIHIFVYVIHIHTYIYTYIYIFQTNRSLCIYYHIMNPVSNIIIVVLSEYSIISSNHINYLRCLCLHSGLTEAVGFLLISAWVGSQRIPIFHWFLICVKRVGVCISKYFKRTNVVYKKNIITQRYTSKYTYVYIYIYTYVLVKKSKHAGKLATGACKKRAVRLHPATVIASVLPVRPAWLMNQAELAPINAKIVSWKLMFVIYWHH